MTAPTNPPRLWETLIAFREQQNTFEAKRAAVRAAALIANSAQAAAADAKGEAE